MRNDLEGLKALGREVRPDGGYDPSVLDAFANRHEERDYWVTFTCPEFTTLCPKTGQPDFATLTIRYIPAKRLVESKSLKLYLFGFRNHGDFHEDVVNVIYVNGGTGARYKALARSRFGGWQGVRGQ